MFYLDENSVSVIVPTYNRSRYIGDAIGSLLAQTQPAAQVIVVDDGSTDSTRDVISTFGRSIQYFRKPNGGKSTALNLGLRHATGRLIWIFDDDDIAVPDALERLLAALDEKRECGFAYGDYDMFATDEHGRRYTLSAKLPTAPPANLHLALMERSFILQQGLLVRKSCYDEVGPFDETLIRSQDLDMMLRLSRRYRGVKVEGITFHLRQHGGMRGSERFPVCANRVVEAWGNSDRRIIGAICRILDLRQFLPGGLLREWSDEQAFTALLQRCCILARKGLWEQSARDLHRAREIAARIGKTRLSEEEISILRRIFDLFSYAPYTLSNISEFRAAIRKITPVRLRWEIRAAILWPLPFTIGAALLNRRYADSWRFLHGYLSLATPVSVLSGLLSLSFFTAGFQLVRTRRRTPFIARA